VPCASRGSIVVKKAGARLTNLVTGREETGYTKGDTTVFDVLHQPRTYSVYRCETVYPDPRPAVWLEDVRTPMSSR
jgi:hypothetical protein